MIAWHVKMPAFVASLNRLFILILLRNVKWLIPFTSNNILIETSQKSEIEITNIEGQIIKRLKIKDNKTDIDISAFSSGVYIIQAKTNNGIITKKFIKE